MGDSSQNKPRPITANTYSEIEVSAESITKDSSETNEEQISCLIPSQEELSEAVITTGDINGNSSTEHHQQNASPINTTKISHQDSLPANAIKNNPLNCTAVNPTEKFHKNSAGSNQPHVSPEITTEGNQQPSSSAIAKENNHQHSSPANTTPNDDQQLCSPTTSKPEAAAVTNEYFELEKLDEHEPCGCENTLNQK